MFLYESLKKNYCQLYYIYLYIKKKETEMKNIIKIACLKQEIELDTLYRMKNFLYFLKKTEKDEFYNNLKNIENEIILSSNYFNNIFKRKRLFSKSHHNIVKDKDCEKLFYLQEIEIKTILLDNLKLLEIMPKEDKYIEYLKNLEYFEKYKETEKTYKKNIEDSYIERYNNILRGLK